MKIYTYKRLDKPGKVITVHKKEERNINFVTIISAIMLFKSNKFCDLKSKKALVKLVFQKLISLKTCDHTVEY